MDRYKVYRNENAACFGDFGEESAARAQAEKFNTPDMLANASGVGLFYVVKISPSGSKTYLAPHNITAVLPESMLAKFGQEDAKKARAEAQSYGVRCNGCGEWETSCTCNL